MTIPEVTPVAASTWLVGGYGPDMDGGAEGVSVMRSRDDGSLELSHLAAAVPSPSFVAVEGDKVYSTLEGSGQIAVFDRDGDSLSEPTLVSSGGQYPCHVTVMGTTVIAANYGTGTLGVIEVDATSSDVTMRQMVEATGLGPRPQQEGPHAHSSIFVDEHTLLSLDLGADRIRIFGYADHALEQVDEVVLPAGFGPRDIVAREDNLFYVLGELGCGVLVFEWKNRQLHQLCSISLPGATEGDQAAAIAISDDSRHAYVGVRHSNLIAVLAIADDGRSVAPLTAVSCEGNWPRHIILDSGILHVCNQLSNEIASFRIDENGIPQLIAAPTRIPSPTYLARIA